MELLGPRLFSVYMNDLPDITSTGEMQLYADYITAFVNRKSVDKSVCKLNNVAKEIKNWCVTNKMIINVDETEAMIMKRKQFIGPPALTEIGKKIMEYKEVSKVLWVYIENRLDWNSHIDKVYKNYPGMTAMLRKEGSYLPKHLKKLKHCDPNSNIWIDCMGTCTQNKFERTRKQHVRMAKLIKNIPGTDDRNRVLEKVGYDPIIHLYKRKVEIEIYKIVDEEYEQRLGNIFRKSKLREGKLEVTRMNSEFQKYTFNYREGGLFAMRYQKMLSKQIVDRFLRQN